MASALQASFKQALLSGDLDLTSVTVKVILIDTADYTYSSAHDNLDDVASAARVATGTLASVTVTSGTFDAADTTLSSVTGDASEALILYVDTGTESTSTYIAYIDGISVTPNGGDIVIQWNASGIFSL